MTEPRIRGAREDDLHSIETLLADASLPVEGVRDFFPAHYAVAENGESIVGAIGVERYGRFGLLRSAVVAEPARGTGLGKSLVEERLQWSRAQGISEVFLLTTTAPHFFEKLGFAATPREQVPTEIQQTSEFASICPASAAVMRLTL